MHARTSAEAPSTIARNNSTRVSGSEELAARSRLKEVQRRIRDHRVTMAAASLAYHWFLALFPAVIAGLGFLSLIHVGSGALHHITHGVEKALPSGAAGVLKGAVAAATKRSSRSLGAVVIGIVVALWSSTGGMAVLEQALDIAYDVAADRKYLSRHLVGFPLMIAVAVLGGLGGALIIFGQPIGAALNGVVPVHGIAFTVVWTAVRWVAALILLTLLFSVLYAVAPNRKIPAWRWVSPGSVIATAVFLAASLGFSYYVSSFGRYSKTYGSFAGVAILLFWLWLVGLAVLVGGEVNAELEEAAERDGAAGAAPAASETGGAAVNPATSS